jgi:Alkaline phytoceramidase (aPHC).
MPDKTRLRIALLVVVAVLCCVAVASHGPIRQDVRFHCFADQRTLLGVPNFWNVVSNLGFLVASVAGIVVLLSRRACGTLPALRPAFFAFFIGSALVSVGSSLYHLAPNNDTMVFDRLPMTIAFMAFLSLVLGEHINPDFGCLSLLPLLMIGQASVLYWWFTELRGHGDLRVYALVQYLPIVLIPLIIILFPSRLTKVWFVWAVLAVYAVAKAFELLDSPIYLWLGISGHTLKHLVAAIGIFLLVVALRARTVVAESKSESHGSRIPNVACVRLCRFAIAQTMSSRPRGVIRDRSALWDV